MKFSSRSTGWNMRSKIWSDFFRPCGTVLTQMTRFNNGCVTCRRNRPSNSATRAMNARWWIAPFLSPIGRKKIAHRFNGGFPGRCRQQVPSGTKEPGIGLGQRYHPPLRGLGSNPVNCDLNIAKKVLDCGEFSLMCHILEKLFCCMACSPSTRAKASSYEKSF